MRERIANLTSNILNPFLVSLILILLLSFESASNVLDAVKWSLLSIAVTILPVLSVIIYLVYRHRLESLSINVREQRTKIYLLASVCAGIGYVVLRWLGAPSTLVAVFVAGLSAVIISMCINLWCKISIHTACIAALVAILIILYGYLAVIAVVLVPLIAWARIELGYHSLAQVMAGALLAASIVVLVFSYLFSMFEVFDGIKPDSLGADLEQQPVVLGLKLYLLGRSGLHTQLAAFWSRLV